MSRFNKAKKLTAIALAAIGLGVGLQVRGGNFLVWNSANGLPGDSFVPLLLAFAAGVIFVTARDKEERFDSSLGCAYGAFILMAFLVLICLAWMVDIGSWGE